MIRIAESIQRAHDSTARTMLTVEAAALELLRRVVRSATEGRSPVVAAKGLQTPVAAAVAQVQAAARRAGRTRVAVELDAMADDLQAAGAPRIAVPMAEPSDELDRIRAERAASGLAAVYLAEAERAAKDGGPRALWNAPKVQTRLALDAATEVAVAFNDERLRSEKAMRKRYAGTNWLPAIVKQWNSTNDKRRCPRCASNSGKIRPIGFDFGGVSPGSVHPFCRCFGAIIFMPIYLGRKEAEAA